MLSQERFESQPSPALILGGLGQDGRYLTELLVQNEQPVIAIVRRGVELPRVPRTRRNLLRYRAVDILDPPSLRVLFEETKPRYIFNLAGYSHVGNSWADEELSSVVNFELVRLLCKQLIEFRERHSWTPYLFQASSSEVFGNSDVSPQTEATPLRPLTPYGVHKAKAHEHLMNLRVAEELGVGIGILYNHESPIRPHRFVSRRISSGVASIALGLSSELLLGSLRVRRDWGFAGDYVQAMWSVAKSQAAEDFIVATGQPRSVRDLAVTAFESVGLEWDRFVAVQPGLVRQVDPVNLVGDASKLRKHLGWNPETPFQEMISSMVAADMEQMRDSDGAVTWQR